MAVQDSDTQYQKPKKVADILNTQGLPPGEAYQLNPDEDAWEIPPPPPKGIYSVQLFLAERGFEMGLKDPDDTNSAFYNCHLECRIFEGDYKGWPIFDTVSSRVPRGKNISTMSGIILKMGYKLPQLQLNDLQQAKLLAQAMKKEPVLKALCDWQGGYSPGENQRYKVVFRTMEDFPSNGQGGYQHLVTISTKEGTKEDIRAQLRVQRWYGKGETPQMEQPTAPQVPTMAAAATLAAPTPSGGAPADTGDDENLLLE